jgi:hypothetical protein
LPLVRNLFKSRRREQTHASAQLLIFQSLTYPNLPSFANVRSLHPPI